jgi:membrane fusion protein (multidrug efflux system)
MNESSPKTSPVNPVKSAALAKFCRPIFLWPVSLALAGLLFLGLWILVDALTHESTDDAFIAGHIISLAPRVAGQVANVYVRDNQMVASNDLLVALDPADYETTRAQKEAAAEAQTANYQAILATLELMQTKIATAKAVALESKADADAAAATTARAKADFARAQDLQKQNTISAQEFDVAKAAAEEAEANLNSARQKADADSLKVQEAEAQLNASKAAVAMSLAQSQSAKKTAESAGLDLSYTRIYAPAAGRVTRKSVEAGDYVQVGQQLMSLVPEEVWVVANFKESQLKDMAPGQPATVAVDALDGKKFRAHVDSIQAGSGAQYSLLPPENATGNFVKVVQRVPVKIVFDEPLPAGKVIGPGLSVMPSVQTSKFALPAWLLAAASVILAAIAALVFRAVASRPAAGN